ncbi:MAG: hypothetical protein ABSG22_04445 [Sedimentisphaerales bacterium]|jgi:hypothetical protein
MCDPTWVLVAFTGLLACATLWLAFEAHMGTSRQISVQTWLTLEARFDSNDMKGARKLFAEQCDPYNPLHHDEMSEEVLDLLESIATVYNEGLLNKDLAESSFSWYATRWWEAAKPYIDEERRRKGDDQSLFGEFETFAREMREYDPKITSDDLKKFLSDEKGLKLH